MKKARMISVIILLTVVFIIFTGCGPDKAGDEISNYITDQMPAVFEIERLVTNSFNSILGDKLASDQTLLAKLKDDIIPNSDKVLETAKAIKIQNKKLNSIHKKYIEAMTAQNSAFKVLAEAIEKGGNVELANKAKELLQEADKQAKDYLSELKNMAKEYGLELP